MNRERRLPRLFVAVIAVACVVGACAPSSAAQPGATVPRYMFSCCQQSDLDGWSPGKSVSLHWTAQASAPSTDDRAVPVTITATLTGPYLDVTSLKGGAPAARTLKLATVTADNRDPTPITSTLTLPTDLAPGLYNLAFRFDYGGGIGYGGASIVRVTAGEAAAGS